MSNIRPNRFSSSSKNRDKIVKNEYYYEYRKKRMLKRSAFMVSILSVGGVCWYIKEVPVKAEMSVNNNLLEWKPEKNNLKGLTFQVLKDGKMVEETKNLKFIDTSQIDTGIPNDIDEITTLRSIKKLKIMWKAPLDNSSNNSYQVFAVNRFGKKVFKTDEVLGGYVSGIDKYIIEFNGKQYESVTPEFVIDVKDIKKGKHTIKIKSIDKAGNKSKFKEFTFVYDVVDFNYQDGKLIPVDSKYTNELYNFYILDKDDVEKEKEIPQYDKKMFLVNQNLSNIIDSGIKPKMTSPSYTIKNKEIKICWEKPSQTSSSHSFYVEAVNKESLDKTYSNLLDINSSSNILGYHYVLNESSNYTVKSTDLYTNNLSISLNSSDLSKDKNYYFHIATIDSSGVLSDTKTMPLNLKVSNPLENKKSILRKIIFKTKGVTNEEYSKVIDGLSNNISLDEIKSFSSSGLKIYIIKNDFKEYLKEQYKIETEKEDCVKNKNNIYYNSNKSIDSLIRVLSK